jgi:hypothetical protein
MDAEKLKETGVLDVGVVALGIGTGDKGVVTGLDGLADVVDCALDATTAFQMVAVIGQRGEQDGLEVLGEQLEHQRVLRFPAFQPLPRSSEHPAHGREAVAGMGAF